MVAKTYKSTGISTENITWRQCCSFCDY